MDSVRQDENRHPQHVHPAISGYYGEDGLRTLPKETLVGKLTTNLVTDASPEDRGVKASIAEATRRSVASTSAWSTPFTRGDPQSLSNRPRARCMHSTVARRSWATSATFGPALKKTGAAGWRRQRHRIPACREWKKP